MSHLLPRHARTSEHDCLFTPSCCLQPLNRNRRGFTEVEPGGAVAYGRPLSQPTPRWSARSMHRHFTSSRHTFTAVSLSHAMAEEHESTGLFRLFPRPDQPYNPADYRADIVAVHGLNGKSHKTWTDKDGHLWLRDSLPAHVPGTRIMTFGYNSAVFFSRSRATIRDYVADLALRLEHSRSNPDEKERPLIFVCHSLGGIVFKALLVYLALRSFATDADDSLIRNISGVAFLGCPHRGSRIASPASMLFKILNTASLGNAARPDLIRALQVASPILEDISLQASALLAQRPIVSLYELRATGPVRVVERFSAILELANERAIPVDADHREIARVSPRKPQRYLPVWTSVKELVDGSVPRIGSSVSINGENDKLLQALFCHDFKPAQMAPKEPQRGTCQWIFQDTEYKDWLNFPPVVLRSFLLELVRINPASGVLVRNRLEHRNKFGKIDIILDVELLWGALIDVLSMHTMRHIFLVIDAVEELGPIAAESVVCGLWNAVEAIQQARSGSRFRVFVSTRRIVPSYTALTHLGLQVLQPSEWTMQEEIRIYLEGGIDDLVEERGSFRQTLSGAYGLREKICQRIAEAASGVFLAGEVAWKDFRKGLLWNEDVVETKLKNLISAGSGLSAFYDDIISRIDSGMIDDALTIFSVIAVAHHRLSDIQLGTILGIGRTTRRIKSSSDFLALPTSARTLRSISRNY
ncbi:hypothetical protein MAPG_09374 [Magnaporthiopsis poae ATCC 64411]|uniref:DUF676 domain-containing protein n=1 Tax=Magnaporthiopsis poae (strain ATCC 64411 / 73-15) TaxID=644358 RepID=A0A0C4E9S6_MAGP6|nr:hypothetical protein MAPG_09374 [Magnaporthiopsis poae ATCC 64411]